MKNFFPFFILLTASLFSLENGSIDNINIDFNEIISEINNKIEENQSIIIAPFEGDNNNHHIYNIFQEQISNLTEINILDNDNLDKITEYNIIQQEPLFNNEKEPMGELTPAQWVIFGKIKILKIKNIFYREEYGISINIKLDKLNSGKNYLNNFITVKHKEKINWILWILGIIIIFIFIRILNYISRNNKTHFYFWSWIIISILWSVWNFM